MAEEFIAITDNSRRSLYETVKSDATGKRTYYILVILAATVATFGLLMNSTTVIIGAMLISPIMNPIIGISLSITLGDANLFKKATKSLIYGAGIAVLVSVLITLIFPSHDLTPEILSRTKPTIIDLIIAFASGMAGSFTMCYKKEGSVLPGVAIATALMPPLCVTGLGIVLGSYSVALGGFLLFLANLAAINLASAIVFRLSGFTTHDEIDGHIKVRKRLMISVTFFVAISIPLSYIMYRTIKENNINKTIENSLKQTITLFKNTDLVNYSYSYKDSTYDINAVVRSVDNLSGENIRQVENALEYKLGKPTKVAMKVILTHQIDALTKDVSQTMMLQNKSSAEEKKGESSAVLENEWTSTDKIIENSTKEKLKLINGNLESFNFSYDSKKSIYNVNIEISGEQESIDKLKESLTNILEDKLNRRVNLNVTIIKKKDEVKDKTNILNSPASSEKDLYKVTPQQ